ncbi:transketolase [Candidatus Dependentiae bacterium]|nr:transketolase [Candidatus Dependentiae bacterium]
MKFDYDLLKKKSLWLRKETLKLHGIAPETRIASSLSPIEIFISLYYGKILSYDPENIFWDDRDRFVISKGHGSISLYPVLADLGFFDKRELERICMKDALLGGIPDCNIPGFETTNGSLGLGLGTSAGIALALKKKKKSASVFTLSGDGELFEGSVWEAVMFAGHHKIDNLIFIIDNNKVSMLDYCKNIIDLEPLEQKFESFKWYARRINGHDIREVCDTLSELKESRINKPKVIIADTIKGKGVNSLETDSLCHIKSLTKEQVEKIIMELK